MIFVRFFLYKYKKEEGRFSFLITNIVSVNTCSSAGEKRDAF